MELYLEETGRNPASPQEKLGGQVFPQNLGVTEVALNL